MKPGYRTTEFWGRAVVTVVGLLVGSGAIDPQAGKQVADTVDAAIPIIQTVIDGIIQIIGLVGALIIQYKHGKERVQLKALDAKKQAA